MSCAACKSGVLWAGTPKGTEQTLSNLDVYVTGAASDRAVLIVP